MFSKSKYRRQNLNQPLYHLRSKLEFLRHIRYLNFQRKRFKAYDQLSELSMTSQINGSPQPDSRFHSRQKFHQQPDTENDCHQDIGLVHRQNSAAGISFASLQTNIEVQKHCLSSPSRAYKRAEGIETPSSHGRDKTPGMPGVFTETNTLNNARGVRFRRPESR